ncbi:MAG TPA: DUF192 domain-containing protein [Chloroflexota bacterium]|nr:DUF192 domain-containing protein [Chloroflexota bacterium]
MRRVRVRNVTRGGYLAENAGMATNFFTRFRGLMFYKVLPPGEGLVLIPGGQIHMFFMRIPLDVIHADKHGAVLRILHEIKPWRLGPWVRKCRIVVELPAGTAAHTGAMVGDLIEIEDR